MTDPYATGDRPDELPPWAPAAGQDRPPANPYNPPTSQPAPPMTSYGAQQPPLLEQPSPYLSPPPSQSNPYGSPPPSAYAAPQPWQGAYPTYGGYAAPQQQGTNSLAIASLVLSLVGLMTCITGLVGAILGHVALSQIKRTGEQGRGMAIAGIVIGWLLTLSIPMAILAFALDSA